MGKSRKKESVISLIAWVLLVLGLLALLMNLLRFNTFSVECNGKTLKDGASGFEIVKGETYTFNLNLTDEEKEVGYTVKIVPTSTKQTDFYYAVSEEWATYSSVTDDLTKYFTITQDKASFTVLAEYDIGEILGLLHPDKEVAIADGAVSATADYFTMIVSLADGSATVNINFRIGYPISLDAENLYF